jgi:putative NADPH-quinone reductase
VAIAAVETPTTEERTDHVTDRLADEDQSYSAVVGSDSVAEMRKSGTSERQRGPKLQETGHVDPDRDDSVPLRFHHDDSRALQYSATNMRVVVVVAHPDPSSFSHAIAATAQATLAAGGHEVTVLDLYAEEFRTAMTYAERVAYHSSQPILDPIVERHAAIVKHAAALVFIYPTWWSMMPAILKGWLERVMVPGVGFVFDENNHVRRGLVDVHRVIGISTYGAPWSYVKAIHDNGRRTLLRALRLNTSLLTRSSWLGLYKMDTRTSQQRAAFLKRVERRMRSL